MARTDKKLLWKADTITHGADDTWDFQLWDVISNATGEINQTIEKVDAEINIAPANGAKLFYVILFITDPSSTVPTGLTGATDTSLSSWLQSYRKQVWMNNGGYIKAGAGLDSENVKLVPFNADTMRTLVPGQKLVLCVGARNVAATADTSYYTADVNVFYRY